MAANLPSEVATLLDEVKRDNQRIVLMTCGLCGSGKSTLARTIESHYQTFTHLSIDKTILSSHGTYDIDYPRSRCSEFQDEAEAKILADLARMLQDGEGDILLDMAFYSKETREMYRGIVEREGRGVYSVVLVVMRASEEALWERIERRNQERASGGRGREGGWEGMVVSRESLKLWMSGFEWPDGEGEIVLWAGN